MQIIWLFLSIILSKISNGLSLENISSNFTLQRIVNGQDIPAGQYVPYQVSLQYTSEDQRSSQHYCGGSIIAPKLILTAAHCCYGLQVERIFIIAGVRDLNDPQGVRARVSFCDMHPKFKAYESSDIAILYLENSLILNNISMKAINVFEPKRTVTGTKVTLTGWGLRLPFKIPFVPSIFNFPNILQTMSYNTISDEDCISKGVTRLSKTEICAQGLFRAACSGDSGGPLVALTPEGDLYQVGIVSYGLMICGIFDVPDVYTRVSEFDQWLQNTTKSSE